MTVTERIVQGRRKMAGSRCDSSPCPPPPPQVVTDKEVGSSHAVWTVDELKPPSGLSSTITEEDWKEIMRLKEGELRDRGTGKMEVSVPFHRSFCGEPPDSVNASR